jgi:hypothetical protein
MPLHPGSAGSAPLPITATEDRCSIRYLRFPSRVAEEVSFLLNLGSGGQSGQKLRDTLPFLEQATEIIIFTSNIIEGGRGGVTERGQRHFEPCVQPGSVFVYFLDMPIDRTDRMDRNTLSTHTMLCSGISYHSL